jgi:hypothetical protein
MWTASASTSIAELLPTFAPHCAASFATFDPETTLGALFELGPPYKLQEILVIFIECVCYTILSTSHSTVNVASTFQTVVIPTSRAVVVVSLGLGHEHSWTVDCRTPAELVIIVYEVFKSKSLVLLLKGLIHVVENVLRV